MGGSERSVARVGRRRGRSCAAEEIHYTPPIPGIDETVHVARMSREARGLPAFAIVIVNADEGFLGSHSRPSNRSLRGAVCQGVGSR